MSIFEKQIFLILIVTLVTVRALPGTIIGNGSVADDRELYKTQLPIEFSRLSYIDKNGVRADGPPVIAWGGLLSPQFVDIYALREIYPQYMQEEREKFQNQMEDLGWKRQSAIDLCIEIYSKTTSTAHNIVASWGNGKGVVMVGPSTSIVGSALETTFANMELYPGACTWK